ncbi:MAG: hypothetical protein HZB13_02050 [Acidobacteria bacterium]|nr:hypothetical protein [Acidobacteriota bacterium]
MSREEWRTVLGPNVKDVYHGCHHARARIRNRRRGACGMSDAVAPERRYEGVKASTGSGQGWEKWKIAPEGVTEAVAAILTMTGRTLMNCVGLRHSRPQRA